MIRTYVQNPERGYGHEGDMVTMGKHVSALLETRSLLPFVRFLCVQHAFESAVSTCWSFQTTYHCSPNKPSDGTQKP